MMKEVVKEGVQKVEVKYFLVREKTVMKRVKQKKEKVILTKQKKCCQLLLTHVRIKIRNAYRQKMNIPIVIL